MKLCLNFRRLFYKSFRRKSCTIITGCHSGIGAATAVKFAAKGAKVVITAHREVPLQDVATKIRESGGEVLPIVSYI